MFFYFLIKYSILLFVMITLLIQAITKKKLAQLRASHPLLC